MVDYSKWDKLEDEDEDERPSQPPQRQYTPELQNNHNASMALIAEWLREADPRLSSDELTLLVGFVAAQHRGIHADNVKRHVEIVAFLQKATAEGKEPSLHALLALTRLCKDRADDADAEAAARATRMLGVATGALNTLWAVRCQGGARPLFDAILRDPEGALAKRYRDSAFAFDVLGEPPDDPRDAPPPEPTWLQKLGKAVVLQLGIAVLSFVAAGLAFGLSPLLSEGAPPLAD